MFSILIFFVLFFFVELFYTERSHVRNLKLLDKLFHLPMARADFCSKELVDLVFPAIQAIIEVHVQLNNDMKAIMKELIPKEDPLVSVKDVASILLKRVCSVNLICLINSFLSLFKTSKCLIQLPLI